MFMRLLFVSDAFSVTISFAASRNIFATAAFEVWIQ